MMKLILIIFISIFSSQGLALVNLRNGSYNEKWVDYIDPDSGSVLSVERFYSSRSLFIGLFGFGWCSSLETQLNITSDGIINLTECGGGLDVTYYPKDFDQKNPDDTINKIIADYKKSHKAASSTDIANLKIQLKSNTKLRFEYANKLGLVNINKIKKKKNVFLAKSRGVEKIDYDGKFYTRKKDDGSLEKFDGSGKLVQHTTAHGQSVRLKYKGRHLSYIVDNKGRRLTFSYSPEGRLKKVSNGRGLTVQYHFQGENLVEVTNMWSKTYKYIYDNSHNLIEVKFPDKTNMKMTYDKGKDWIKSYTNRKGCRENFDFILSKNDPQNNYTGTFSRQCKKGISMKGYHEFWYQNYTFSKDKYLHRVYEEYNTQTTKPQASADKHFKNIYFHPYLGKPVSIQEDKKYRGLSYFLNGLISKREDKLYTKNKELVDWQKISFKYNYTNLNVVETLQSSLNKLGKITSTDKTKFSYDNKNHLSKASKSNNQFVKIAYDDQGNIDTLTDQNNNVIKLTYKVGTEKPIEIEQVAAGKVFITYNDDGEIESVDSKGQRNIATSVIEKFIAMISFLGPLGEDLKI